MDYGLIGKIEKAKFYAEEPERISFDAFTVQLQGDSGQIHVVEYNGGSWTCDCNFFHSRGYCSHTMAMERVLGEMVVQPGMS